MNIRRRSFSFALMTAFAIAACSGAENPDDNNDNGANNDNHVVDNNTSNMSNNLSDVDYTGLVINEVAATGDPNDWFELHNTGSDTIDLTGVTLSDDPTDPAKAVFEAGTEIEAGAYMLWEVTDEGFGFKLGGDEEFYIYDPQGNEIDGVDWDEGESPAGRSFGRFPNGTGAFKTLNTPTPGAANVDNDPDAPTCGDGVVEGDEVCDGADLAGATCESEGFAGGTLLCATECDRLDTTMCEADSGGGVVINEVTSAGDDLIELYNASDAAIDIGGWYIVDDGWDAAAPDPTHRYDFPAGTELAAGAYLVLTKDVEHPFGVGGNDAIIVYDADDMVVDQTTWPDGDAETSWCRIPDGTGDFQVCSTATFGASNMP